MWTQESRSPIWLSKWFELYLFRSVSLWLDIKAKGSPIIHTDLNRLYNLVVKYDITNNVREWCLLHVGLFYCTSNMMSLAWHRIWMYRYRIRSSLTGKIPTTSKFRALKIHYVVYYCVVCHTNYLNYRIVLLRKREWITNPTQLMQNVSQPKWQHLNSLRIISFYIRGIMCSWHNCMHTRHITYSFPQACVCSPLNHIFLLVFTRIQ